MLDDVQQEINKCSRCGGCQAFCPLFTETGRETFVARGKIELLDQLRAGKLVWNDKLAEIFSTCLLCGSCAENCPNGVEADKLVRLARKDLVVARGLPVIKRNVLHHLLTHNGRLNAAGKMVFLYQASGVQRLVRHSGILQLFAGNAAKLESLLPRVSGKPFRQTAPSIVRPEGDTKLRVAYFTGCMTNHVYQNVGQAVLKVLHAFNTEVIIPKQYCCGVPALAAGDMETGLRLARQNVREFSRVAADYIITDCASCLATWLEYPDLLQSEAAARLSSKVMDINRFLVEILDIRFDLPALRTKVTYHDPCHLKRTPQGKANARELLQRLSPYYEFVEMDMADKCCGSAGSFSLSHYELSQRVAARKVDSIIRTQAEVVASACPSCIMQLAHSLGQRGLQTPVRHSVELVAQCLNTVKATSI